MSVYESENVVDLAAYRAKREPASANEAPQVARWRDDLEMLGFANGVLRASGSQVELDPNEEVGPDVIEEAYRTLAGDLWSRIAEVFAARKPHLAVLP